MNVNDSVHTDSYSVRNCPLTTRWTLAFYRQFTYSKRVNYVPKGLFFLTNLQFVTTIISTTSLNTVPKFKKVPHLEQQKQSLKQSVKIERKTLDKVYQDQRIADFKT